jgi:hypothetical protein
MKKLCIGLALAGSLAAAQAEAPRLRMYINAGYSVGGDQLMSGVWVDPNDNTKVVGQWDIKAGAGTLFAFGADYRLTDKFFIQASVGEQRGGVDGTNLGYTFRRVPAELLGFYAVTEQTRLGIGVRKTSGAAIRGNGLATGYKQAYESSMGTVLEGQYFFTEPSKTERSPLFGIYMRFVREEYRAEAPATNTKWKSGNHIGAGLMFYY